VSRETFRGSFPADRLYDVNSDMWVMGDATYVVVGATGFGLFLAGPIIAFTAKPRGAEVIKSRGLGTVESSKTVVAVHAPLSLVLDETNEAAECRPQMVNEDPYGAGWMARGRPLAWQAERGALVDADAYARHVQAMEPDAVIEA
jgi:glycine cleavage system H protein